MSREKGGAGCVKLTRANQIVLYLTNYTPSMLPTVTFANEQLESALANSARTTATCCGVGSQVAVAFAPPWTFTIENRSCVHGHHRNTRPTALLAK